MADHNEILEAANDIIKNVTPGNPNAMVASNKAIALALISIAQDVHAMRGDMDEILEAANDIIKNVTPGNPNAMVASNKAIALALISIAQDVHAMRGDMDEMRKMTRTLDEIRGRLNFRR